MNKLFIEYKDYYQLNELTTLFNNKDSLIIFDTNIFLDLYSYPLDTRNSILDSIDKIVGNLWSPHNIFLEYHKNRREVIYKSKKILDEIKNTLGSFSSDNILKINAIATYQSKYGKFHSELTDSIQEIVDKYKPLYAELQQKLAADIEPIKEKLNIYKKQDTVSLTGEDPVLNFLLQKYTDDKIGQPYSFEQLQDLYTKADERIAKKIPPAFKDSNKTEIFSYRGVEYESKYGDFLIFRQIIDYCSSNKITTVFFISNDVKRDWREQVPHENDKYYGARKELKAEAYLEANIENFILLDLKEYFKVSGVTLPKDMIEDIEALKRLHKEQSRNAKIEIIREELREYENKPLEILDDLISKSKNKNLYLRELKQNNPKLFEELMNFRESRQRLTIENLNRILRLEVNNNLTNEPKHQRLSENMQEEMIRASRVHHIPEDIQEEMIRASRVHHIPEDIQEEMIRASRVHHIPEDIQEEMIRASRVHRIPEDRLEEMMKATRIHRFSKDKDK
ncbi:PIN-like domain-containing protein [Acinetobacter baumannii]